MPPLLLLLLLLAVAAGPTLGYTWVAAHERRRKSYQSPVGRTFTGGNNGDREERE